MYLILQGQIVPHERGGLVAIAYAASVGEWIQSNILGIVMAKPGNVHVSIATSNHAATEALFSLILARGCPQRLCTSEQTKSWIRSLLLQHYQLQRESDQQGLICTQAPDGAAGRWAQYGCDRALPLPQLSKDWRLLYRLFHQEPLRSVKSKFDVQPKNYTNYLELKRKTE